MCMCIYWCIIIGAWVYFCTAVPPGGAQVRSASTAAVEYVYVRHVSLCVDIAFLFLPRRLPKESI